MDPSPPRRPRALALRWHLLALTVGALLPLAIYAAVVVLRLSSHEQRALERNLLRSAQILADALDRDTAASFRSLEMLARSGRLEAGDLAGFREEAVRVREVQPSWLAVVLASPDGRPLVDTRGPAVPTGAAAVEAEGLAEVARTGERAVGNLVAGRDGRSFAFALRVPVTVAGEVRYVLGAVVSAAAVAEGLSMGGRVDEEWTRTVVDRAGVVVARSRDPNRFAGERATPPFLEHTRRGPAGVYQDVTLEGLSAYVAFSHAKLSGWTTAAVGPASVVQAPYRRSVQFVTLAGLGALILSAGGGFLVARRFARAIGSAAQAADALAHGRCPQVEPQGIAEVERLGAALRRSAELLETGRREAAAHLTRAETARAEAETASRAKDEFLAMLGHELRNPLSPIVTALKLLEKRGKAGTREHEIIARQVGNLVRLVDDLLDVSRVTRGKVVLHPERVELAAVVTRAVEMAGPLIQQRQHDLAVDVPPGLALIADPVRMAQVVANLLTNAARYTPPQGHLTITARRECNGISLSVTDDGQGIAPDLLPRVFDLFVQGARTPDRPEGGLGIGLTLVRTLVSLHGGQVQVSSEGPGKGSTFRLLLPPAPEAPAAQPVEAEAALEPAPTRRLRILVVDDNADAALLLAELFARAGHQVATAHDGPGALGSVAAARPDLVVLDIGLPGMDGYEVAARIRERLGPDAPCFLAVTGYGQARDRERSRAAGFLHHFVKPADPGEILAAVNALASGPRLRRASGG